MNLVEEMKSYLSIPVYPSKELCSFLRKQHKQKIKTDMELYITEVFDSGEQNDGIICALSLREEVVVIASLTYLVIKPDHPLFGKISAYQEERIKRISR